jgi:uncharacterized membrane protein HdeD (DUF308 family)
METIAEGVKKSAGMTVFFGVLLMIGGIGAIALPFIAGLSVALMVGWLFLFAGVLKLVFAFKAKAGMAAVLWALLSIGVGGYMIGSPGVAAATLVIVASAFLLVSGIAQLMLSLAAKPAPGWGFGVFGGLLSIGLSIMMWLQFPVAGTMAIGIILGFNLLFSGITLFMLGLAARKGLKTLTQGIDR